MAVGVEAEMTTFQLQHNPTIEKGHLEATVMDFLSPMLMHGLIQTYGLWSVFGVIMMEYSVTIAESVMTILVQKGRATKCGMHDIATNSRRQETRVGRLRALTRYR